MEPVSTLVRSLGNLLQYFQRERHHASATSRLIEKDREEAMLATDLAIRETRKYLDPLRSKDIPDVQAARDRDMEYRLAELWSISAIRSQKFMDANINYAKSQEWLQGMRWEGWDVRDERLNAFGMALDQMQARLESMIAEDRALKG